MPPAYDWIQEVLSAFPINQMRIFHTNSDWLSSNRYALLFVMAGYLTAACSRQAPVHASNVQPAELPTVAVVRTSTEDLSRGLVFPAVPGNWRDMRPKVAAMTANTM
jgi:hypothetical protein